MTHRSFALPQDLSPELQQTYTRIQPQLETIALTGATLDVVLRSEHTRIDTLIDLLTQLSAMVQEITHQQNTPDEDLASTPRSTKYIQLAQFLEQNLSMQHTGRPKGWELTGINTFTGHHVSFNMDIQSIDQTGTLRGPLRHSVYTIVVTGFPIDEAECPALGTQFQGIGTITHLNVVGRTAEILWRCANEDYT